MPDPQSPDLLRLDTRRPFTRADALAAGVSQRMLQGSRFRRLFRGVYIDAKAPVDELAMARAALLVHPNSAYASHMTAARVYRLPVPHTPLEHVSVLTKEDRRTRPGLRSHVGPEGVRVVTYRGVPVADAASTFVALAAALSLVDLVVVGDAMVRIGLITVEDLVTAVDSSAVLHAVPARRAVRFVRRGVDSPMESRLRMLIVLSGLPEPVVNHIVYDPDGRVRMRFDLSYPWLKLIVEYDGRQHADDPDQWLRDIARREELDGTDWRLIVVTAQDVYQTPARTLARIQSALRARGATGLPRRLSNGWLPYFPGRSPA